MGTQGVVLLVLGVYLAAIILLGVVSRRRSRDSLEASFLGQGQASFLLVFGGSLSYHIGSGFVVGGAEYGALYGIGGAWYGIGCGLSFALSALLIGRLVYRNQYVSLSDYFVNRYQGTALRLIYSISTVLGNVAMMAGQLLAGRAIFLSVGIPANLGVALTAVVSLVYTMLTGMLGTLAVATFQSLVIFVGMAGALAVTVHQYGMATLTQSLPTSFFSPIPFGPEFFVSLTLPTIFATLINQGMFQRLVSAKTEKIAIRGYLLGGLVIMPVALIPPMLGMFGRALLPEAEPSAAFMQMLLNNLPVVVVSILLAAIVCSVLGSCNAAFISSSAIVLHDICQGVLGQKENVRKNGRIVMMTNLLVCAVSVFLAIRMNDIIRLLTLGYLLVSSGSVIPFFGGILWKRGTSNGALTSAIVGMTAAAVDSLGIVYLPYPCITSILISAAAYVLVSLLEERK